ncbi:antiviral reverse transcriptase Drt4 [Shewanella sp. SP2S2-4]|uniref:antiviral reverse transcriptase Drt4 n=1 Tax=Shewanella TaxID=22 RepID=UPI0001531094|nr:MULTISPECIES: antiviral reverse transcriptase Drt4 [Shewanella]ACK45108.1 conserved hypothetical protein [Shewanella baltica OS223]MDT3274875.1 antiviral reverse transcriptase Drt4 [Shewanella sp. SP2S2-4]
MLGLNDERNLYEALTRRNYFPNQKETIGELPPCIDSRQFTPEVCEALALLVDSASRRKNGYDLVEYKATRYNNVPRTLALVHPKAYAFLVKHICDNWDEIKFIQSGDNSIIKPELRQDGRIMVMNYEAPIIKKRRYNEASFSKKFCVKADIANCFNSIYTHAIPWAAVGVEAAKNNRENELWYNKLDMFQRKSKRGETQGIPIGPATSSFVVELILQKVDQKLSACGFNFERYVDDYQFYCDSYEQAQQIILVLGQELSVFKLTLNLNKTYIVALPSSSEDDWVLELLGALPNRFGKPEDQNQLFNAAEAITFLNRAIAVNKATPDGSVLKYAVQLITPHIDDAASHDFLSVVINLSWHYPILIPYIAQLIDKSAALPASYLTQLDRMIIENAKQQRSDGMAWPLHILKQNQQMPSDEAINAVITSGDCVSITILHSMLENRQVIVEFAGKILGGDDYQKDNYWLLLYQLFLFDDLQDDPYGDDVFPVLKRFNVNFIPDESISEAEQECEKIRMAFVSELFSDLQVS